MKIKKTINWLFNIYSFLFIFTMINKEFLFLGIDLRFILLPLGIFLTFLSFTVKIEKADNVDKIGRLIIIFYLYIFITNISWLWNGLTLNKTKFINENILLLNNLLCVVVFYRYKNKVNQKKLNIYIIISALILMFSMICVSFGIKLKDISGSLDVPYMYSNSGEMVTQVNIFGKGYRAAGYASDPNYATLLMVIACLATSKLNIKKWIKALLYIIFGIGIGLAFSKTIVIACIMTGILMAIYKPKKIAKDVAKVISVFFIMFIVFLNLFIAKVPNIKDLMPLTLKIRFTMWDEASKLTMNDPIIGNGITSFRSYFKQEHWYVQCHSTYWQLMAETGIIGELLFVILLYKTIMKNKNNKTNLFLIIVYIVYAMTCETIAMQFTIYILYILGLYYSKNEKKNEKKALFLINSLSNGGAERVCINMANELLNENYIVDFILLGQNLDNKVTYDINPKIRIFDLKINEKNKIKKIIKILNKISEVDEIISENEKQGKYDLITSHLPMANILTLLSIVANRSIYVFHTKVSTYSKIGSEFLYKILINFMFRNKKVATVSEGLRKEAILNYNLKEKNLKTIYNPIDAKHIIKQSKEKIDLKCDNYILHVGRFNEQKRQDRMLEVFYKGKFYNKYKLVFCGTGELEEKIKKQAQDLKISDSVIFAGWQSNIYKWMKNSSVLVCTSDCEAFPMTLIEALICKARVVSSNCDFGPNEILIGDYANFLVKTDDIDDYIKKINQSFKEYPTTPNTIIEKCNAKNIIYEYLKFMKE